MPFAHVFLTGASSGLGRGLALHYARAGATVYAAARRRPELDTLSGEAGVSGPGRVVPIVLDVTDAEFQVAAIRSAEEASGGALDLVVANAGLSESCPAAQIDWGSVKRVLDLNVTAAAVTLAAALPAMVARGSGTVVAVSSLAAFRGLPANAAYCASKAALHTFMESLRVDLRGTGVKALTLYPGFVKTEMTAHAKHRMPFLMELDPAVRVMAAAIDRGEPVAAFPFPLAQAVRSFLARVPRSIYEPLANLMRPS